MLLLVNSASVKIIKDLCYLMALDNNLGALEVKQLVHKIPYSNLNRKHRTGQKCTNQGYYHIHRCSSFAALQSLQTMLVLSKKSKKS